MAGLLHSLACRWPSRCCQQLLVKPGSQLTGLIKYVSIPVVKNHHTIRNTHSGIPKINDREQEAFVKVFKKIIEAEQNNPKSLTADRLEQSQTTIGQFPETLKPLVRELEQAVLTGRLAVGNETDVNARQIEKEELDPEAREIWEMRHKICKEAYDRTAKEIEESETDLEVLDVLERELFAKARILEQEEPTQKGIDTVAEAEQQAAEEILSTNYSSLLVFALKQLKSQFSGSSTALAVYSLVKSAGSKSHALAACTQLYNLVIEANWRYYGDARQILDLLEEMDRQGLDFDQGTAGLVKSITQSMISDSADSLGKIKDSRKDRVDLQDLVDWRDRIMQRIQEAAARRALELAQLQNGRASSVNVL